MYRPFLFFVTFFIPGIVLGTVAKTPGIFIFLFAACVIGYIFTQNKKIRQVFFAISILFLGAFYYNFRLDKMVGTIINYADKNQTVVGIVCDMPTQKNEQVIYDVKALYLLEDKGYKNVTGKVRVSSLLNDKNTIYGYGDVIKFSGKLKIPQGRRNPNGVDYRAYLLQKGISTVAFSREIDKIGKHRVNPFISAAFNLRERLTAFYETNLPPNLSGLLIGITLGIKDNIPRDVLRAFGDGGATHVLAVSGLHMGVIYAALKILFQSFGFSRILSFVVGSFAMLFYSFMAGLSPSAIRAAIMIIVFMLSEVVGRENDSLNSLCLSAVILLLLNPLTLFSVSFQLSYAAVCGILLFFGSFKKLLSNLPIFLRDSIAVILSAQLMVGPFLVYYFNKISVVGVLTNLLVVPLVSVILITGILSGVIGVLLPYIGLAFLKFPSLLLSIVEKIIFLSSKIPYSTIVIPTPPSISIALYFMALALSFNILDVKRFISSKARKIVAVFLFIVALIPTMGFFPCFEVTFVDVGQGDSILVRTEGKKVVLIDGGGMPDYYSGDFDTGYDIVIPYLHSKGINHIDVVVFTHFDDDHAKGLLSVLQSMKVDSIVYGIAENSVLCEDMLKIARQKGIKIVQVSRGDWFVVDDAVFKVLHPDSVAPQNYSSNDSSVVLKMSCKGMEFMFTGDLEYAGEQSVISSVTDLNSYVLKVGHHGSSTSTSQEFLYEVNPRYAVISVGKDNSFGHPSDEVLELLKDNQVTVLRTDFCGAVTFKIRGRSVNIYTTIPGSCRK